MASRKIRVVAYLDPTDYKTFKALLPPRDLDFSKWVRRKVKEELVNEAVSSNR